ncbi:MAG TPA: hypothetical protein VJ570_04480 [Holophagaceae bacterium]|nr:hypothetical protein [Holophagaceae bacterium]
MRRTLRTLTLPTAVLLLATACDTSLPLPLPDFRVKVVAAVETRFDARPARLETRRISSALFEVKVWMKDPATGKEQLKAICWFDNRHQLTTLKYVD